MRVIHSGLSYIELCFDQIDVQLTILTLINGTLGVDKNQIGFIGLINNGPPVWKKKLDLQNAA